jgi:hypothetical protein
MRNRSRLLVILGIVVAIMSAGLGARAVTAKANTLAYSNWYHLYDEQSGKCLDNWSSYTVGTPIRQYNCYNGAPQLWQTIYWQGDPASRGWMVMRNDFSYQCIWVQGNHPFTQGEPIVQEPCNFNFQSLASIGENWYFELDYSDFSRYLSAVCTGESACGGSYGSPTNYFIDETTKTNGAVATIRYVGDQNFQGPLYG